MKRTFLILPMLLMLSGAVGCDPKATDDECQTACKNVSTIAYQDVEKAVRQDGSDAPQGESGRKITMEMAQAILISIEDRCIKSCATNGTHKKTECLANATNAEELRACK